MTSMVDLMATDKTPFNPKPHGENSDVMTMEEFIDHCKAGSFIDYDGMGQYADETHVLAREWVYPSMVINGTIDKSYSHVTWYNR